MRIKLAILAAAVGTVAATTASAAFAAPGASSHPVPTPTSSAADASAQVAPGYAKPAQVEPTQVPPGYAKPVQVQPTQVPPGYAKPVQVQPVQVQPVQVQPVQVQPVQVQPTQVAPGYAKPVQVQPTQVPPGYAKPVQVQPVQAKPAYGAPAATTSPAATAPAYSKTGLPKVVTLTAADAGKTVQVNRGEQVRVKLAVKLKQNPNATTWWHAVIESGAALQPLPQTLMARRGVTLARYRAVAAGTATLSSSRAVCPPDAGAAICHAMQGWQVTIDVR